MVWYVVQLKKAIGVLKLVFPCLVRCFKLEMGQKRFQLHYSQYKIDTASVYSLLFSSLVEPAILKKQIKVISSVHLKQNLSLENN